MTFQQFSWNNRCVKIRWIIIWILISFAGLNLGFSEVSHCKEQSCCDFSSNLYTPPKMTNYNCYTRFGHSYRGTLNTSSDGQPCLNWKDHGGITWGDEKHRAKYGIGDHNYCRNPDSYDDGGPWCYVDFEVYSKCKVLKCSEYPTVTSEQIIPPDCTSSKNKINSPDMMYTFRNNYYFLAKSENHKYVLYKYNNAQFLSFGSPPTQPISEAWNLCLSERDKMTFVSSYDDESLYVYFQIPNRMVRINLNSEPQWEMVEPEVYERCLNHVLKESETKDRRLKKQITQVFKMNEEKNFLFLLVNLKLFKCEWRSSRLLYVSYTSSPFGNCADGTLRFVSRYGQRFQLMDYHSGLHHTNVSVNDVITSSVKAVESMPGLAAPLLGYYILNRKSIVKLSLTTSAFYDDESSRENVCKEDGWRGQIFKIYDSTQWKRLLAWLWTTRDEQLPVFVDVNYLNVKKSRYCVGKEKGSCCFRLVQQVTAYLDGLERRITSNDKFMKICKLQFTTETYDDASNGTRIITDRCPKVECNSSNFNDTMSDTRQIVCEISFAPRPKVSVKLEEILEIGNGNDAIEYRNAREASKKMQDVAASLDYQKSNSTEVLSILVKSVQALKLVNYNYMSYGGAEALISDVVKVFNHITDEGTMDSWINLNRVTQNNVELPVDSTTQLSTTARTGGYNEEEHLKSTERISPAKILLTVEKVLQKIVSGRDTENRFREHNDTLVSFAFQNVMTVIQRQYGNECLKGTKCNITFTSHDHYDEDQPVLTIVSTFPKLTHFISRLECEFEGKEPLSSTNHGNCQENTEKAFEYLDNSPIISASMIKGRKKIPSSILFTIPFNASDIPDPYRRHSKFYFSCNYLVETEEDDVFESQWDGKGCTIVDVDYSNHFVQCACNHTTNFAILLQIIPPKLHDNDKKNLRTLSYVGESISLFCLLMTMIAFIVFRRSLKSARMVAHFHLVLALIIFHLTQVMVALAEKNKDADPVPCIIVTALTHFSLLAAFCWMLCEGLILHMSVINVFTSTSSMKILRYLLGWGVPALISGISLIFGLISEPFPIRYVQGTGEYSKNAVDSKPDSQIIEWCWLSTSNYLILSMTAPALLTISINAVVLARVSWIIAKAAKATNLHRPTTEQRTSTKHVRKCLKGALILMPILGIPWLFGFIPQSTTHVWLLYTFTVLNSLQGFFIFLFYCVLSTEVRAAADQFVRRHSIYSQNMSSNYSRNASFDMRQITKRTTSLSLNSKKNNSSKLMNSDQMPNKDALEHQEESHVEEKFL